MDLRERIEKRESGLVFYGLTPPRMASGPDKALAAAARWRERLASVPADALVLYDLQDESSRTDAVRPFPFMEVWPPREFSRDYLEAVQSPSPLPPRICYLPAGKRDEEGFRAYLRGFGRAEALVLVGSPSSRQAFEGLGLARAYEVLASERPDLLLGGVLIPERHAAKGDEHLRVAAKAESGCSFFVSQCVYGTEAAKNYLCDYQWLCHETGMEPAYQIFTLTVCGSAETLAFMKWLGIGIPHWMEKDLEHSADILSESLDACLRTARELRDFCERRGIPWGFNVESVSIRKVEIEASLQLARMVASLS